MIKKACRTILFLSLLIYIMACKEGDGLSDFRVIDAATKQGVPNDTVELYETVGGDILTAGSRIFREQTMTNPQGEYHFDYDTNDGFRFLISAGADRYWESTRNPYRQKRTIELYPEGYVRVKATKLDTTEYALININSVQESFWGNSIDTSFVSIRRGNSTFSYTWFIHNNIGESTTVNGEEFYIPPHDTTTFEIIF